MSTCGGARAQGKGWFHMHERFSVSCASSVVLMLLCLRGGLSSSIAIKSQRSCTLRAACAARATRARRNICRCGHLPLVAWQRFSRLLIYSHHPLVAWQRFSGYLMARLWIFRESNHGNGLGCIEYWQTRSRGVSVARVGEEVVRASK